MEKSNISALRVLHVEHIPLECQYDNISTCFSSFGNLLEIRMNLKELVDKWEAWITFENHEGALKACANINDISICNAKVNGALTDNVPRHLDTYKPSDWLSTTSNVNKDIHERQPKPPKWLVVTVKGEKYNYYKFCRYIQKKVGGIESGDISRFGKNKVLIQAKSKTQSYMLALMNGREDEMVQEIKPHLNFSYGRGVIFDRDLYDLDEHEILEMSPPSVWKVKKIPRANMIILTFEDSSVPDHVYYENERVKVKPFLPKPLQCYNCYKFGHPSSVCRNIKICRNCSSPEHGPCSEIMQCANCKLNHDPTDKKCEEYKFEETALLKAHVQHITVPYAKRLLGKHRSYAKVVKHQVPSAIESKTSPKVHSPMKGAQTPVISTKSSGSNALPARAEALSSKTVSLSKEVDTSSHEETLSESLSLEDLSQPSSLPVLMKDGPVPAQKRDRDTSESPSPPRKKDFSPQRTKDLPKSHNKSMSDKDSSPLQESITIADIHHPPDSQKGSKRHKKGKSKIPKLSRDPPASRSRPNNERKSVS